MRIATMKDPKYHKNYSILILQQYHNTVFGALVFPFLFPVYFCRFEATLPHWDKGKEVESFMPPSRTNWLPFILTSKHLKQDTFETSMGLKSGWGV